VNDCIDPGDVGVAYEIYPGYSLAQVMAAGTLHYEVHDFFLPETPDPARPTVTVTGTTYDTSLHWYEANGTVRGASLPIHNVEIHIFPRDACGLLGEELSVFPTVSSGSTATFTTGTGAPFDFTSQLTFASYLR
jgi:hypothetical protein